MPKVLIADELSPRALEIFRSRGVDVDVRTGLSKTDLLGIIAGYDGLAVRSATKADKDVIGAATRLKVIGRAGIGVDNIDIPTATARGIVVMNTPLHCCLPQPARSLRRTPPPRRGNGKKPASWASNSMRRPSGSSVAAISAHWSPSGRWRSR